MEGKANFCAMSLLTNTLIVNTPRLDSDVSVFLILRFRETYPIDTLRASSLAFTVLLGSLSSSANIQNFPNGPPRTHDGALAILSCTLVVIAIRLFVIHRARFFAGTL